MEKNYISGPCLLVNKILELNGCDSIDDFVELPGFSGYGDFVGSALYIQEYDLPNLDICQTPRIGLTLKKYTHERATYLMQHYRYVIYPKSNKKGKNLVALSLYHQGKPKKDITRISGSQSKHLDNWIKSFEKGKERSPQEFDGKTLTVSDTNELYGACSQFIY